jgi:hypothetical protein
MKANEYISKQEHKFLLIFAFTIFVFAFSVFSTELIEDYNRAIPETQFEFSNCGIFYSFPPAYLSSIFILFALLLTKRFLLSLLLTLSYILLIVYAIYVRFETFADSLFGELSFGFIEQMEIVVYYYDYVIFTLTLILLFWQISILLRMLIKTLQRKNELP